MIEGSGSVSLTNGSGCRSGRPKNMRILRIRIRNTAGNYFKFLCPMCRFLWRSYWLRSWATLCPVLHIPASGRTTSSSSTRGRQSSLVLRIRIRDPVPFWPLDPGSVIGFFRISDPGSQTHIFESLVTIFWVKSSIILCKLAQIFFYSISKIK